MHALIYNEMTGILDKLVGSEDTKGFGALPVEVPKVFKALRLIGTEIKNSLLTCTLDYSNAFGLKPDTSLDAMRSLFEAHMITEM